MSFTNSSRLCTRTVLARISQLCTLINTVASARGAKALTTPELFQQFAHCGENPLKRLTVRSASLHRAKATVLMRRPSVWCEIFGLGGILFVWWLSLAAVSGAMPTNTVFKGNGICQFAVYKYLLTPQTETSINQVVVKLLKQHSEVFGFQPDPLFRVRIRIFGQFEDYQQFAVSNKLISVSNGLQLNITNLAGFYSPATREVVTWRQRRPTYLANNIMHESSHAIMHGHFRRIPQWLLEGSGSYFSFPRLMQDPDDVNSLRYRWAKLDAWLTNKTLPALPNFVSLDWAGWHRMAPECANTVSWSIFQFLMSTPQQQQMMRTLLREMQGRGVTDADCSKMLNDVYPGGIQRMEQNWHNWIRQNSRKILSAPDPKWINPRSN